MISFIYVSNRPGSIDLLAHSFKTQESKDYELIVVDGYPGRVQRGEMATFLREAGVNLAWYGEPKPKLYPDLPVNFAGAMNTGLQYARSENVVFLHDFCVWKKTLVETWEEAFADHGRKAIISGVGYRYDVKDPQLEGDLSVWEKQDLSDILGGLKEIWIPEITEIFFTGANIALFEALNGFDERGDAHITFPLYNLLTIAPRLGYRFVVDRELHALLCDHRKWESEHVWNWNPKEKTPEPGWQVWANEGWCLRDVRAKWLEGK